MVSPAAITSVQTVRWRGRREAAAAAAPTVDEERDGRGAAQNYGGPWRGGVTSTGKCW